MSSLELSSQKLLDEERNALT